MRIDRAKFAAAVAVADIGMGELAARSGLSRATVTSVKGGKRCTDETAAKLAASLGVTVDELREQSRG